MAAQIVLNRKRRAKEERNRAPNGSQFDNPMYYAESDITSEDDGAGEQMGMEEAIKDIEDDDHKVVNGVYRMIKERSAHKTAYIDLLTFILFTALYMTVLYLQQGNAQRYQVTQSMQPLLPQDTSLTQPTDVFTYLNETFISTLWADPIPTFDNPDGTEADGNLGRYAGNHNRILGGLLVHQARYGGRVCARKRFQNLFQYCSTSSTSKEPFGVNPIYVNTSVLYNPNVTATDYYAPAEINSAGIPYALFFRKIEGLKDGFPVVFDINLSAENAANRLQYLADALYLDNATDIVTVRVITYNGDAHHFAQLQAFFTFQPGGKIAVNTDIKGLNVEVYAKTQDWVRAGLEALLVIGIAYGIFSEVREAIHVHKSKGSVLRYFSSLWNFIDVISLALLVYAVIHRIFYVVMAQRFTADVHYDIYQDLNSLGRPWGLKLDGSQYTDFADLATRVATLIEFHNEYVTLNGINVFLMILRVLKLLDFQPQMGILTRALAAAGADLLNFFILWGIIFVAYAYIGNLMFGGNLDAFRSLQYSLTTMFMWVLGDTTVEYTLLAKRGWELWAGQLLFITFQVWMVFIVMQFLIAIAVDAFVDVKLATENAPGMFEELYDFGKAGILRYRYKRLPDKALLRQLKQLRGTSVTDDTVRDAEKTGDLSSKDKELIVKVDGQDVDTERLKEVLERRTLYEVADKSSVDPTRVAEQVMAQFGLAMEKVEKIAKKPKKNEELHKLKEAVDSFEKQLASMSDVIQGRLNAIHGDMAVAGMSRSTIPEEGHEDLDS